MTKNEINVNKQHSKDIIGKYFVLNKTQSSYIQGWMNIEKTLKLFIRDLKEEIEYELDSAKVFIEHYLMFFIDLKNNKLVEIKDDKTLNSIRRNNKIFIVLLDKSIKFSKIEDIPSLYKWYLDNLANYES
ncbi:MAG: hypothetical protein ACFE9Q_09395 [Candidatus Hodarchaeota archaeon]